MLEGKKKKELNQSFCLFTKEGLTRWFYLREMSTDGIKLCADQKLTIFKVKFKNWRGGRKPQMNDPRVGKDVLVWENKSSIKNKINWCINSLGENTGLRNLINFVVTEPVFGSQTRQTESAFSASKAIYYSIMFPSRVQSNHDCAPFGEERTVL